MMRVQGKSSCPRRGITVVETSVVLLICLLFFFAIFEYGRFIMFREIVDNAAREGARQAVAGTSSCTTATIQNTVIQYLAGQSVLNSSGQPIQASDILVYQADPTTGQPIKGNSTWTNAQLGQTIAVQVNAVYQPMLPTFGFLPSSVTMKATVLMASEAN